MIHDYGIVTAYGYAKSKGYAGTEDEFAELLAHQAQVAQAAAASAEAAAESAGVAAEAVQAIQGKTQQIDANTAAIEELMYKPIAISSFTVSPSVIEMCADYDGELTLNFSLNREPKTLKLDNQSITARASGSETRSNLSLSGTKTFTLTATDEKPSGETDTVSKTAKVYMYNSIYYGVGPDRAVETSDAFDTFLNGLTPLRQGSKETEFTVNAAAGQYIWFALPKRIGAVRFQAKGGLEGGFDAAAEISHKNSSNYTEAYYVYRSTEANLGNVTIITF